MANERMGKLEETVNQIQTQLSRLGMDSMNTTLKGVIIQLEKLQGKGKEDFMSNGKEQAHEEGYNGPEGIYGESSHSPHVWHTHPPPSQQPPQLDMHKFDGSHASAWLAQMDQYFKLNHILDDATKFMLGSMYFDNERWQWWEWHQRCNEYFRNWTQFTKALRDRFEQEDSYLVRLTKLRQTGHKCKEPKFFQIDATDYNSTEEDPPLEEHEPLEDDNQQENVSDEPVISLHALAGISSPQTLKIRGFIKHRPLVVLIDSGSTHNFIHQKVTETLHCFVRTISNFQVQIADGGTMKCEGYCENVKLQMGNYQLKTHMFAIHMGGCDIVLGADWLRTLGPITMDFQELYMSFKQNNHTHTLRGLQAGAPSIISSHRMEKLLKNGNHGVVAQFNAIQGVEAKQPSLHPEMQQILSNHLPVYDKPQGLPPPRVEHDHNITLVPGAQPPNVRPYRYPFTQKNEIEKIIKELLEGGLIRPNISPYSSPVVMVLKKYGEWKMCPDFKALNKLTVKDKCPIVVVDDLLDELNGAQFFTKLDLRSGYHQIRMKEVDIPKTAFRTHEGHYEFLVMPFGLCNAPSAFQSLMNHILKPYLRKFVLVFFDDILIYSCTWATHLQHVDLLLQLLHKQKLFVKMSKCSFGMAEVEYLGHIVGREDVKVDPKKIQAMQEWPQP
eukprot:PITA_36279